MLSLPPGPRSSTAKILALAFRAFVAGSLLSSVSALDAPPPRIERRFQLQPDNVVVALLATDSTVIEASRGYQDPMGWGWSTVRFWDAEGDAAPTERSVSGYYQVQDGSFAVGDSIYLAVPGGFLKVDRDPSVAQRFIQVDSPWQLRAAGEDCLVMVSTQIAKKRQVAFVDLSGSGGLGSVELDRQPEDVAVLDGAVAFTLRNFQGGLDLVQVALPAAKRGGWAKAKVTKVAGDFHTKLYMGRHHAVFATKTGEIRIVRWNDPTNKGNAKVYSFDASSTPLWSWTEAGDELACFTNTPSFRFSRLGFASGQPVLEPVGLPEGFVESKLIKATGESLFLSAQGNRGPWLSRVHLGSGRQLLIEPPVGYEIDGGMAVILRLDAPAASPVTITYETAGLTATAGVDFTPVSGTATIATGESEVVIEVPVAEDFTIEKPESLEFRVTGLFGARCDCPVVAGKIQGSGLRILEKSATQPAGTYESGDKSSTGSESLELPGGTAEARRYGFEYFSAFGPADGTYAYAMGRSLSDGLAYICQFDPASAVLLEAIQTDSDRMLDGDQLVAFHNNRGFIRYGFFDGFPVPSFSYVKVQEGAGPTIIPSRAERMHMFWMISGEWQQSPGGGAFTLTSSIAGDSRLQIQAIDDRTVILNHDEDLRITLTHRGTGETSTSISTISFIDDDSVTTKFVPLPIDSVGSLAVAENNLWVGEASGNRVAGFQIQNHLLTPVGGVALPGSPQWLVTESGFLAAGELRKEKPFLSSASLLAPKIKFKGKATPGIGRVAVMVPQGIATGDGEPVAGKEGRVRIFDKDSKKLLRTLAPETPSPTFGYAVATSADILWVAAPSALPEGGRVFGYSLEDFSLVRTLSSPEPLGGGIFGISIAASDEHLVIGEVSNSQAGAAWVFSPDGSTLFKRLDDGGAPGSGYFGTRVAARGGHVMVSASIPDSRFRTILSPLASRSVIISPGSGGYQAPVFLWMDVWQDPVLLREEKPLAGGSVLSGYEIALLDDGAVVPVVSGSSDSPQAGLYFYPFPSASAGVATERSLAGGVPTTPVWPAEGSSPPEWSIAPRQNGEMEVSVTLDGAPAEAGNLVIEWSPDLIVWTPVADFSGVSRSASKVLSTNFQDGTLKVSLAPSPDLKGFFRLRAVDQ